MQLVITPSDVFLDGEVIEDIHNYLWVPVCLKDGVCLRRLFELMESLIDFWGILLNENVVSLFKEMPNPLNQKNDLVELRVSVFLEKFDDDEVIQSYDFSGINKEGTYCAIEFTPVNKLADIPVKIKTEFAIWHSDEKTILGNRDPLLIELFKAIFSELSFFGSPEARDEAHLEIKQALEDIENGKGTVVLDLEDLRSF